MNALTVTAYNVGFGDALLVAIPDRDDGRPCLRHILIDMGNVLSGEAGNDALFRRVAEDILRRLDGKPADLYVMTHEHLDHVKGLRLAHRLGLPIPIDYAWLTASSHPRYHDRNPEAATRQRLRLAEYERVATEARALGMVNLAPVQSFLENNDPASTQACIDYIRQVARRKLSYVHRGLRPQTGIHHPFQEATLAIWAPEYNTADYYGRFRPLVPRTEGRARTPRRPPGVEAAAYRALLRHLRSGLGTSMLAIDKAANNTSVAFLIQWQGWRLLFPGDAELRSWQTMDRHRQLRPVHFLKISHHGSHNGTPTDDLLSKILPADRPDRRRRVALVSTWPDTYSGVPAESALRRIRDRVDVLYSTRSVPAGESMSISFHS